MLALYADLMFYRYTSVALTGNVMRCQDMADVGKALIPVICRPQDVRRCQIGLYVAEEGRLQLLRRCVLPEFPI